MVSQLQKEDLTSDVSKNLKRKLEFLTQLKENVEWQLLPDNEKHALRIEWIASLRKRKMNADNQVNAVKLYDKVKEVIPYIKVLNRHGILNELENLCQLELEFIDFSGRSVGKNHVEINSVEKAFEPFFIKIKTNPNSLELPLHPEAELKVEELYHLFIEVLKP